MKIKGIRRVLITDEDIAGDVDSFYQMLLMKLGESENQAHLYSFNGTKVWITRDLAEKITFTHEFRIDAYMQPRADGRYVIDVEEGFVERRVAV